MTALDWIEDQWEGLLAGIGTTMLVAALCMAAFSEPDEPAAYKDNVTITVYPDGRVDVESK